MSLPVIQKQMIEEFQCPGCVCGSSTSDGCYKVDPEGFFCNKHVAGTIMAGIGVLNLGLPKGFNRVTWNRERPENNFNNIRLYEKFEDHPGYNFCNVPVWAMEHTENGMDVLLVRCYMPRVNYDFVDVILNGKLEDVKKDFPYVYDVAEFIDDID